MKDLFEAQFISDAGSSRYPVESANREIDDNGKDIPKTGCTRFPMEMRRDLLSELAESYLRPRITGSIGVDLAFTAEGIFGTCVSFSPHVWDNAAGVMLVRAAGGVVTDTEGNDWAPGKGVIAGTAKAHAVLVDKIEKVRAEHGS